MPTYEYVCSRCGHQFEKIQPITDKALTTCPEDVCARKKWERGPVKRKIGAGGGLLFKGSGFYITDYRSEGYKQAAKKDSKAATPATPAKPDSGKTTPAKTETKPARDSAKKS